MPLLCTFAASFFSGSSRANETILRVSQATLGAQRQTSACPLQVHLLEIDPYILLEC